jgi:N,N'-diacetylchitobiose transport system substrate-binding protein
VRKTIAVTAALTLTMFGAAACGKDKSASSSDDLNGKGKTLTIWLMVDAESAWPNVVEATNTKFKEATGADVKVEYQQWNNHLTKLDSTLAGADVPDVIELGNTEATKYVFSGAFADISKQKSKFDNSATWLTGLSAPCEDEAKLYCAPYYAGARVLFYRKDLFDAAGLQAPKTQDEMLAAADKLQQTSKDPKFYSIYAPGVHQYAALSWVYGSGGQIAMKSGGKWKGTLSDPKSLDGLTKWGDLQKKYSKADKTKNENDQAAVFSQGHVGMFFGAGCPPSSAVRWSA